MIMTLSVSSDVVVSTTDKRKTLSLLVIVGIVLGERPKVRCSILAIR